MCSPPSTLWRGRCARDRRDPHCRRRTDRCFARHSLGSGADIEIELYEARPDPRRLPAGSGRSINLALADRGIHALKAAGVFDDLGSGTAADARPAHSLRERRNSIPALWAAAQRSDLFGFPATPQSGLIEAAAARSPAYSCISSIVSKARISPPTRRRFATLKVIECSTVPMQPLLATDGAGSAVRRADVGAKAHSGRRNRSRAWLQGIIDSRPGRRAAFAWPTMRCIFGRAATSC